MIKANELRVGNYVSLNGKQVIVKDIPYLVDDNREGYLINEVWADEYEPIPLTPEILEKCGFEKIRDFRFGRHQTKYSLGEFVCIIYDGEKFKWIMYDARPMLHVKYLHQFQNLYFALTGEELNIELNAPVSDTTKA